MSKDERIGKILNNYWKDRKAAGANGAKAVNVHRRAKKELMHEHRREVCRALFIILVGAILMTIGTAIQYNALVKMLQ